MLRTKHEEAYALDTVAEDFRDADASAAGDRLVACLDFMNRLDAFRAYKRRSWELLAPSDGGRIADVACGVGFDAIEMAERWPRTRFVGVDRSAAFLAIARARAGALPNVEFAQADAKALGVPDASFDAARMDRSLQHIENPAAVVAELARVVRPGGRIVISEPDWDAFLIRGVEGRVTDTLVETWRSLFRNRRIGGELPGLMDDAGLVVERVEAAALAFRTYQEARVVFDVEATLSRCVAEGRFSEDARRQWRDAAEAASAKGRFVALLCIVTVLGRRSHA